MEVRLKVKRRDVRVTREKQSWGEEEEEEEEEEEIKVSQDTFNPTLLARSIDSHRQCRLRWIEKYLQLARPVERVAAKDH